MAEEKTEVEVTEPEVTETHSDDFEKRYKDSQAHISKIEQENATIRQQSTKDKELLDTVTPFIDWDKANGNKTSDDDDEYVDKKTLKNQMKAFERKLAISEQTNAFRLNHPDMVPYEDLVGVMLGKTDTRKPMPERIESAVSSVKKLLESERVKGREEYEKEKKEKTAKEAETSGLSTAKGPKGQEKPPEAETKEGYTAYLRERQANKQKVGLRS